MTSPITVIDVGARWGAADRWAELAPELRLFGFDPDAAECARLNELAVVEGTDFASYVPVALADSVGRRRLHLTVEPACSSFYPPIEELASRLPELRCIVPAGTEDVLVTTLDAWCADEGIAAIDAIKLDTQGSELDVLRGAEHMLESVQVIESEVEFNPIYDGQPLFADLDTFLRARGFVLWRLDHLVHYSSSGSSSDRCTATAYYDSQPVVTPVSGGQIFWGHAYYVPGAVAAGTGPYRHDAERMARLMSAAGLPDLAAFLVA